jgi:hypothetical protein
MDQVLAVLVHKDHRSSTEIREVSMLVPLPESEPALVKNLNQPGFLFVETSSP